MQLIRICLLIAATCALPACKNQTDAAKEETMRLKEPTFAANYHSGRPDWTKFLQCWRENVRTRLELGRGYSGLKTLPSNINVVSISEPTTHLQTIIAEHEVKLGVRLPKSYKHFLEATNNHGWYIERSTDPWKVVTLLPLEQVGRYPDRDPKNFEYWKRSDPSPRSLDLHRYMRYGYHPDPLQRQDGSYFVVSQLDTLLLIGAFEGGGAILLNPNIVSTDGEFETWVLDFKTFAWRYRSFAEMMQNEAYFDIALDDAISPLVELGALNRSPCTSLLITAAN